MLFMVVTLEVSRLSGWLNARAFCRKSKGGHTVWGEVCGSARGRAERGIRVGRREAARATAVQAACGAGLDCRLGAGHGHGAHGCCEGEA